MSSEQDAERGVALLSTLSGGRAEADGTVLHITLQEGASVLIEVLRTLDSNGLTPVTLTVRDPSLDDVFLALTGHHVEETAPSGEREMAKAGAR